MLLAKQNIRTRKAGFTLVEVLVVVTIMGILSTMGVVGLQRAVANARVKDAAVNTAAFVERVGNEAIRMSSEICLAQSGDQKILAYKVDSKTECHGTRIDSLVIDAPNKFTTMAACGMPAGVPNMLTSTDVNKRFFKPKTGLSAVPVEGAICIQYGSDQIFGAARKLKTSNSVRAQWKVGNDVTANGADWMDL